jgi:co-chaperonin GroES (HSP10)
LSKLKEMKQLLGKRIWVEPISAAITESGIILESVKREKFDKERPDKGIIKFVGDEITSPIKLGDKIRFNKMAGKEITYRGMSYITLHEQDVEGVYS